MIANSIPAMTVIDLIVMGFVAGAFVYFHRRGSAGASRLGTGLILFGLSVVAAFYLADLVIMWVLPAFTSRGYAMELMRELHLNGRWWITLVSLPAAVAGFILLRRDLDRNVSKAIRASERVAGIVNALPDALLRVRRDGLVLEANPAARGLFGLDEDAAALRVTSLFADWDAQSARSAQLVGLHREGRRFPAAVTSTPFGEGEDLVLIRDVSDRADLERQLRQSQKLESLGRLSGGVAHEFNNYLTVILGESELLQLGAGDPAKSHKRIHDTALKAAKLTSQLLSFSRTQVLDAKVTDLNQVVADIEGLLGNLLGEQVEICTVPGAAVGSARVDQAQLEQAIVNLAINAKDAMPHGGRLTIATDEVFLDASYAVRHPGLQPGRYAMISVSDTGVGMDAGVLECAFEPFFTTKAPGQGTGLGLAMVAGFVEQSGGTFTAASVPGEGTRVCLYFPVVDSADEEAESRAPSAAADLGGNECVLLVEDGADVRDYLNGLLSTKGYRVRSCADVKPALEALDDSVDLILTDVVLPNGSGLDLANQVRQIRPDVPVIQMSGYTQEALAGECDLLRKPFGVQDVLSAVRRRLDG